MTQPPNRNAPPGLVYAVLLVLAFVATLIVFGNQAGWWSIDF
jgi:hypothetical protein